MAPNEQPLPSSSPSPSQPRTEAITEISADMIATDTSKRAIEEVEGSQENGAWKKLCSWKAKGKAA